MRTHRELFAWQRANASALGIHRFVDATWQPRRAIVLEQLRRASLSVPMNIAEGFASGPGGRCRFHLRVAYGSDVETTELLRFLASLGDGNEALEQDSLEVQKLTLLLLRHTNG